MTYLNETILLRKPIIENLVVYKKMEHEGMSICLTRFLI